MEHRHQHLANGSTTGRDQQIFVVSRPRKSSSGVKIVVCNETLLLDGLASLMNEPKKRRDERKDVTRA